MASVRIEGRAGQTLMAIPVMSATTAELRSRLAALRETILAISAAYGASHVRIFGSVARGEATETSDIDFLVEMAADRSLLDRIGLMQELSDLLDCEVDVVSLANIRVDWRDRVTREAIEL